MAGMTAALPAVISVVGTSLGAAGKIRQGNTAKSIADSEAAQLEQSAIQQVASSQRAAMEEQRNARLAQSRALAVAAASGGGASDPTVINLMAKLAAEGTYRGMVDLYQGQEKARQLNDQAAATRYSGEQARKDARYSAAATAISGASSLYSKYAALGKPGGGV